jgi:hypothetical protein
VGKAAKSSVGECLSILRQTSCFGKVRPREDY